MDLNAMAAAVLDANLPEGYQPVPNTLKVENLTQPELDNPTTGRWQVFAQRRIQAAVSPDQAVRMIAGLTPEAARQRLESSLPLGGAVQVSLNPAWWPRLPLIPFRIAVTIR
jgi:hypothetical protein